MTSEAKCSLCQRVTKKGTTEHHLIPRTCHKNKWFKKRYTREQMNETVPLCEDCHRGIHKFVPSEKELGRDFNTIDKLLSHKQIGKFVEWVSNRK